MMQLRPFDRPDGVYTTVVLLLLGLGLVTVYSSSFFYAYESGHSGFYYLKGHLLRLLPGILLFFLIQRIPYYSLRSIAGPGYIILISLLILTFVVGNRIYGARRWLQLTGFSVQVSELSKLWIVIYLAALLSFRLELFSQFKTLIAPLCMIGSIIVFVLIQPNFSMAIVMVAISFYLMILGGVRMRIILPIALVLSIFIMIMLWRFPHTSTRISHFFSGSSQYQVDQSRIAIGSGGLIGHGIGTGKQKLLFLPKPFNDFIFAIWAEETGFIGSIIISGLFLILFLRGIVIANGLEDSFAFLLVSGMNMIIFIYFLFHTAIALGIVPPAGVPLPFISFGGWAVVSNLVAAGIIVGASRWRVS